jgi:hypothetical protein
MRRNEDLESMHLRSLEDALHVLDRVVLGETFAKQRPWNTFFAEDFVLRIDEYDRCVGLMKVHGFRILEFSRRADPGLLITRSERAA